MTADFAKGFYARHPKLRAFAPPKVLDKTTGGSGAHGEARQHGNEVWLFPKFWDLPADVQDFVFAHEIGHYVKSEYGSIVQVAADIGIDVWDSPNLPFGQFNMDEAFADAFASHFLTPSELRSRYPQWEELVRKVTKKASTMSPKPPTKSQIDYAKHLLKQVGADEPEWDKLDGVEVGALIDALKKKRGKPVWHGNGSFSHWEKEGGTKVVLATGGMTWDHARMMTRVAARYLAGAAITPEKLTELLLKIRKGATASFTWKNLADVLPHLGIEIEKTVGLVPVDGFVYGYSREPENHQEELAIKEKELDQFRVTALPTHPKPGQVYLTTLGPIMTSFRKSLPYEGAVGAEGWKISMPGEKSYLALPYSSDLGDPRNGWKETRPAAKVSIYGALTWLGKEAHWKDRANQALNMEAHVPADQRTRDNTGTCGVCWQNIKLKGDRVVLHGYKRPGTGSVYGDCFGAGYLAFELAPTATKEYLTQALLPSLEKTRDYIQALKSGKITKITRDGRDVSVGDPSWDYALPKEIESKERSLDGAEAWASVFRELVSHWKERPLPKPGEPIIDWFSKGRKGSFIGHETQGKVVLATRGITWEHGRMMLRVAARFKEKKKIKNKDGEERTVYVYSERQIALRNAEKARKIEHLKSSFGKLRAKVKKDLRSEDPETKLTALAVALIDQTYERVGNDNSVEERGHFGVTGWQKGHLSFGKGGTTIQYTGKSGVKHKKRVTDDTVKKALRDAYEAVEGDDSCLFEWEGGKVSADKVNAYLKTFDVTAKDLRGFHANRIMGEKLRDARTAGGELPSEKKERQKILKAEFKTALEETAGEVGHEAATLRSQYLVPNLESTYLANGKIDAP